MSLLLVTFWTK